MPTIADKRQTFRKLHESGCFVIPNPWNVGTARYFQHLGFKALATTSSGFAHVEGFADGAVPRDVMLQHLREIVEAADVPVNADFEGGYADDPDGVAESVRLCAATGVAGLSIEDSTGDAAKPLYDFDLLWRACAPRVPPSTRPAARLCFTARTEGFVRGRPDLEETIRRLKAFADAGADCLYSPGIKTREEIVATVKAVAPKPVNLLMSSATGLSGERYRRIGRAAYQRWRHACACRLERGDARGARDRRARQVRQLRRRGGQCRAQCLVQRRRKEAMTRILITGAAGMIGRKLTRTAGRPTASSRPAD